MEILSIAFKLTLSKKLILIILLEIKGYITDNSMIFKER